MAWVDGVAVLLGIAVAVEGFRAWTRRRLVEKWAADEGFTLLEVRYTFGPFDPTWLVPYRIRDKTGHEVSGTAWATGFLRRKVFVDWGGQPRWGSPGP